MTTKLIEGFDVSHFQAALNRQKVAEATHRGYGFCGFKTSEGTSFVDPNFEENRAACRAGHFPRFLYHELTTADGAAQARHLTAAVGGVLFARERVVVVMEQSLGASVNTAVDFVRAIENDGPVKHRNGPHAHRPVCVVYASASRMRELVLPNPILSTKPRWVASVPSVPNFPYTAHQYSSGGDPLTGGDRDRWHSDDREELERFFLS